MSWAGLSSNQMVTFTNAQSSPFLLNPGQSAVTSNECMTKNDALTLYSLSASAMSAYASNQLVPKSVWVNGLTNSCMNMDVGSFTEGQLYADFSITFVNAPLITTNFTVSITGLTSGFGTSKTISTADLTLGGTYWIGQTVAGTGSGYSATESGFVTTVTPINDGTYYHGLCSVVYN